MDAVQRAVMADLGRARQEELPLSTLEGRGPSFIRPRQDYSRQYDSGVKNALGNKWSTKIVDEESVQMQGLANLSTRPWAEGALQQRISIFAPPLPAQPSLPPPLTSIQQFTQQPLSDATNQNTPILSAVKAVAAPTQGGLAQPPKAACVQTPNSTPVAPAKSPSAGGTKILELDNCIVTMSGGRRVEGASALIYVRSNNAFICLKASGKLDVTYHLGDLQAPVLRGTVCTIKSKPGNGSVHSAIDSGRVESAVELIRILYALQRSLTELQQTAPNTSQPQSSPVSATNGHGANGTTAAANVPSPAGTVTNQPVKNLSQLSRRPQQAPKLLDIDKVRTKNGAKQGPVDIAEVFDDLFAVVRSAYCRLVGASEPLLSDQLDAKHGEVALADWMQSGNLDSETDPTKSLLLDMIRFLMTFKMKLSQYQQTALSESVNELKDFDTKSVPAGGSIKYSADALLELRVSKPADPELQELKEAVAKKQRASQAPKAEASTVASNSVKRGGLASSRWAK